MATKKQAISPTLSARTAHSLELMNLILLMPYLIEDNDIELYYIDLFCGAGGTSTGVELARVNGKRIAKVIGCVNHDKNAIASHFANHPEALHFTEDIRVLNLSLLVSLVKKIRFHKPHAKIVLWASLECTNFSKAKGGLPRDADSRTLAEHLFRYIEALDPDYLQIENVEEFMAWGDLDANGKPVSKTNGKYYRQWVANVQTYGYDYSYRILNAADYGAYTSRRRFFGTFAKRGLPIEFPEPTHCKTGERTMFSNLQKWKAVKDCLDFSDEGKSIFGRKKELAEPSKDRVMSGLIKFVAGGKDKWIMKYNSVNKKTNKHNPPGVDEPCPVVSCQNRLGVVQTTFLSKYFGGHPYSKNVSIEEPAGTITTIDHHSVINAQFLSAYYGNGYNNSIDSPSPTLTTKDRFSLVSPFFMNNYSGGGQTSDINNPCPAVTTSPKQNLVQCHFIDQQFGQSKAADVNNPLGGITTNPKYNVVGCKSWLMNTNFGNVGSSLDQPSPVITANRKWHYLMDAQYSRVGRDLEQPCFTLIARMDKTPPYLMEITKEQKELPSFIKIIGNVIVYEIYDTDSPKTKEIKEFMAIYGLCDIKMRMLRIPELKMIMGFPKDYVLKGTQAEQKKYIGNAVEVNQAKVNCEAIARKLKEMRVAA